MGVVSSQPFMRCMGGLEGQAAQVGQAATASPRDEGEQGPVHGVKKNVTIRTSEINWVTTVRVNNSASNKCELFFSSIVQTRRASLFLLQRDCREFVLGKRATGREIACVEGVAINGDVEGRQAWRCPVRSMVCAMDPAACGCAGCRPNRRNGLQVRRKRVTQTGLTKKHRQADGWAGSSPLERVEGQQRGVSLRPTLQLLPDCLPACLPPPWQEIWGMCTATTLSAGGQLSGCRRPPA